jgi:hypothetical protein
MRFWVLFTVLFSVTFAQEFQLEILVNDQSVSYQLENGSLEGSSISTTVTFDGGKLELNLADWTTFNYAHVLATTFEKTSEHTYTVSATIRHNDTGWDNYADAFEVKGQDNSVQDNSVQNGLRILAHPHETEQPFTRSQSGVVATGLVWVEAKDNLEGLGGSKIYLDLSHPMFDNQNAVEISYTLTKP